jgi:tRNA nucleotidyltransferase (CCA-adding enzyme)
MLLSEILMRTQGYIVGGAIRNRILNLPISDYDIVTPFTPEELKNMLPIAYELGERFGTVIVNTDVGLVEITTMRKDISSGRHPKVEFTTSLLEDLSRRDFTMNSIAEDVLGKRYDPYNGISDIQNRLIRCVGNPVTRISEDKLRALRAIRFSSQLNFRIDSHLSRVLSYTDLDIGNAEIIIDEDGYKLAQGLSIERVMDEFQKMLLYNPVKSLESLSFYNLLPQFLPEVHSYKNFPHNPLHHKGNLWQHVMEMLSLAPKEFTLQLCIIFHDVGKIETQNGTTYYNHDQVGASMIPSIASRLKLSTFNKEAIQFVCANHMKLHNIQQMRSGKRQSLYNSPYWYYLYETHKLDELRDTSTIDFIESDLSQIQKVKPLVNGHDVMALGVTGKPIATILETMLNLQLDGNITSREQALALLSDIIGEMNDN